MKLSTYNEGLLKGVYLKWQLTTWMEVVIQRMTRAYDREMIKIQLGHLLYVNKGNIVVAPLLKRWWGQESIIPIIYQLSISLSEILTKHFKITKQRKKSIILITINSCDLAFWEIMTKHLKITTQKQLKGFWSLQRCLTKIISRRNQILTSNSLSKGFFYWDDFSELYYS